VLFSLHGQFEIASLCVAFIAALMAFLLCNLELLPGNKYKAFMGDSGSFFIGFTVITLLIIGTQGPTAILSKDAEQAFRPASVLWIIAIPLMDMLANVLRRLANRKSPFLPDRGHLHHILQETGLTDLQVLKFICGVSFLFTSFGVVGEVHQFPEPIMFGLFIVLFLVYFYFYSYIWKVSPIIHRLFKINVSSN